MDSGWNGKTIPFLGNTTSASAAASDRSEFAPADEILDRRDTEEQPVHNLHLTWLSSSGL